MDDFLLLHHSLTGCHPPGMTEVLLLSTLRKSLGVEVPDDLLTYAQPHGVSFANLRRSLSCFMERYSFTHKMYPAMDKKEELIFVDLNKLSSTRDFIEAVLQNDTNKCEEILIRKPKAIRSVDDLDRG